jgi:hypothetical protein
VFQQRLASLLEGPDLLASRGLASDLGVYLEKQALPLQKLLKNQGKFFALKGVETKIGWMNRLKERLGIVKNVRDL